MKRTLVFFAMALVVFGPGGCRHGQRQAQAPVLSVSILPLNYFADRLTEGALEVNVMIPPGASHATYSPTPGQLRRLSDSRLYLRIGHLGYEKAFIHRLSELNPGMQVVDLSEGLPLIRGEAIDHGDHVHEGGIDPHIWTSPKTMLKVLPVIRQALATTYPHLEETLEVNYASLLAEMQDLHERLNALSGQLTQTTFMIFHPALTYLARDYGFEQLSIERGGKEPTPAHLARIINQAREHSIRLILIQEEFDIRSAALVSEESGAALVQINPLAYDWMDAMEHLIGVFKTHLH